MASLTGQEAAEVGLIGNAVGTWTVGRSDTGTGREVTLRAASNGRKVTVTAVA